MARRRFFATALGAGEARLQGAAAIHVAQVLRAQPGDEYELAHGGQVYLGRILEVMPGAVRFALVAQLPAPAPVPARELAAALFKFDRFEWMVEKATELGLTRLHPLVTQRTGAHLALAAAKRVQRWRTIALQAAEQSRRGELPEIAPPLPLAQFLAAPPAGTRVLLSEQPGPLWIPPSGPLVLLSGPEGGWTPAEFAAAAAAGFVPASLGPRILRCETAVLAALARAE